MNIFLIGASGFVSGTLARMAVEAGHAVTAVSRGNRPVPNGVKSVTVDRHDQEAFKNAQLALKAKRLKEREAKAAAPKKTRGRPANRRARPKKVILEESSSSSSSSSSESEQEVVYVQRRKKTQRKTRKPKPPRVVYVTDSSEEDHESEVTGAPPDWFKFV